MLCDASEQEYCVMQKKDHYVVHWNGRLCGALGKEHCVVHWPSRPLLH